MASNWRWNVWALGLSLGTVRLCARLTDWVPGNEGYVADDSEVPGIGRIFSRIIGSGALPTQVSVIVSDLPFPFGLEVEPDSPVL